MSLYPIGAWLPLTEKVTALPNCDPDARSFRRPVFAEAADLALGGQGRILATPELRRYAGLEREALVVEVHAHLEVWNPEAWAVVAQRVGADGNRIAEMLADLI